MAFKEMQPTKFLKDNKRQKLNFKLNLFSKKMQIYKK